MITYQCPDCSAAMSSPDSQAGGTDHCPECGLEVAIPRPRRVMYATRSTWISRLQARYWLVGVGVVLDVIGWYGATSVSVADPLGIPSYLMHMIMIVLAGTACLTAGLVGIAVRD